MKKTIIVMPIANEEKTIGTVIEKIMKLPYDNLYLFAVMDSYSKDRTEEIVRKAEKTYNGRVKCIFYEESKGVVTCYLYGFHMALKCGAEYVIEMDGGGSHDPAEIPSFIKALDDGYECVWGSRFVKGGSMRHQPLYRRLLSSGGTVLSNIVLGTKSFVPCILTSFSPGDICIRQKCVFTAEIVIPKKYRYSISAGNPV